jgi:hypothetical protein
MIAACWFYGRADATALGVKAGLALASCAALAF